MDVNTFWVKDFFYIERDRQRYYICHDNSFIYDIRGIKVEKWLASTSRHDHYLIPLGMCNEEVVKSSFLIYFPWISLDKNATLRKNGKLVSKKVDFLSVWVLTSFKTPDKIDINDLYLIKTKPETNVGVNQTLFIENRADKLGSSIKAILKKLENRENPKVTRKYKAFFVSIPESFPRKKYVSDILVSNLHFGQLKLLLSEIEFLSIYTTPDEKYVILYPGGGPGDHVPFLSQMFPNCYFILIDPVFKGGMKIKIVPDEKIIIIPTLFDPNDFLHLKGNKNVFMISDIRSTPKPNIKNYEKEFEKNVLFDMELQKGWASTLQVRSLLKFRLPYHGTLKYLSGKIYTQAFAPKYSTEMRIVVDNKSKIIEYDCKKTEEELFYFNTEYRPSSFWDMDPIFGANYDILRMKGIVVDYLEKYHNKKDDESVLRTIREIDNFFKDRDISILDIITQDR